MIDVTPNAANGPNALVPRVTATGPRTYAEIDISALLASEIRNLTMLRDEVVMM
jgi:hypothetical protein